ncbi:MAG TPA: AAA family ATPase [Acidimicrobiia bacterium]|nr:AAA family ATPase [Acidimicrobiia bacterium]
MGGTRQLPGRLQSAGVTRREAEVLAVLAERLSNAEIAKRLFLSERTVESHVSSLLHKLGVGSRAGLAEIGRCLESTVDALPPALASLLAADGAARFVSRVEELALAERVLGDPARKRAATLWITGEPGIGKTRLAAEIAQRAHAAGALVLFGRCNEDLGVPYQPFLESLQWFTTHLPDEELPRRLGDALGELTRLVPALGARLAGHEPRPSPNPEIEQYRLFEAVRSWLARAAEHVVLVVDDVHWATTPTLQLLGHVAGSVEPSRAVLICTARDTTPDHSEALARLVDELDRRGADSYRLELRGLQVHAVGELVERVLQRSLDERLRTLTLTLHRETAGNPLFVRALLASLSDDHDWPAGDMPRSVADTVRRRLRRLPGDLSEVLRVAAVVGLEFDVRLVARAGAGDELATLEALEAADQAGLIEEAGANRYRFVHALVRAALRDELSDSRRVRLHQRVGEALESLHGEHADDHASALAHHFFEAVPVGEAAKAYRYSLLAARRAEGLLSHEEAAEGYARALAVLDHVDGVGPNVRCELLLARGKSLGLAGDVRHALETLQVAADEAAARGLPEHLARAAIAYEDVSWRPGFLGAAAVELLERAESALPSGETKLRALTVASLGRALELSGRRAEAVARGQEALAMANRLSDPATTARALWRSLFSHMDNDHAPLMAARCAEGRKLAEAIGDDDLRAWSLSTGIIAAAQLGDLGAVDEMLGEFAAVVAQLRQPWQQVILSHLLYVRAFLAGDLAEAERRLEEGRRRDVALGWGTDAVYGSATFLLRRETGGLEAVAPALEALVATSPPGGLWRPGLAALYAELGMLDDARREFESLAAGSFAAVPADATRHLSLGLLAEVCCALGDAGRAACLFEELRPLEGQLLVFQGCAPALGPADRLLGMLASTAGDDAEAERLLGRAVAQCRALPAPIWLAHCLYDSAIRLPVAGTSTVRDALMEAADLCERHGLVSLGRRVAIALGQEEAQTCRST